MAAEALRDQRLSLGLPLLLPAPLRFEGQVPRPAPPAPAAAEPASAVHGPPLPVKPEQPTTEEQGRELDEPIA
jgi:hypothetical protein